MRVKLTAPVSASLLALVTGCGDSDATFATDNHQAGLLIGQWAKAKFEAEGKQAKSALLVLSPNQVSVDVQRDQGFLEGFGVDVKDKNRIGDESDPRIVGHDVTDGAPECGRTVWPLVRPPSSSPRAST